MGAVDSAIQQVATEVAYDNSAATDDRTRRVDRATQLRYALTSAGGSWGHEFRLLLALAEGRGVSLDVDALTYYDVRDLQAFQRRIVTVAG